MAQRYLYNEADFNLGIADLEILHPDQRGEFGEDDPADLAIDGLPEGTHCVCEFHRNTVPPETTLDDWGESRPTMTCTSQNLGDGVWRQTNRNDRLGAAIAPKR